MGKKSRGEDEFAEDEKNLEIKKMKEELQREARGNFEGPEDDDESPFLSYKHSEDVEV
jgi:hypothetical protein